MGRFLKNVKKSATVRFICGATFAASHQSYGSRRMGTELSNKGITADRSKVHRLMHQAGLEPVWRRIIVHTTDSKNDLSIAATVLAPV